MLQSRCEIMPKLCLWSFCGGSNRHVRCCGGSRALKGHKSGLVEHAGMSSRGRFRCLGRSKAVSEQSKRALGSVLKPCCLQSQFLRDVLDEITTFGVLTDSQNPSEAIQRSSTSRLVTVPRCRDGFRCNRVAHGWHARTYTPPLPPPKTRSKGSP